MINKTKEKARMIALMALWKERHPNEKINSLDDQLMKCLVILGEEYDRKYKQKDEEARLYKISCKIREWLGINIVLVGGFNNKNPMNDPGSFDKVRN
jgi:Icc-related predicted phosphoesterase